VIRVVGRCVLEGLPLTPALLYHHPTPESLSAAILDGGMEGGQRVVHGDGISSDWLVPDTICGEALEAAISAKLRVEQYASAGETKKVLLTGATGFFGCRLLCELLSTTEELETVVCLVRCESPSHGLERIIQALEFQKVDLPPDFRDRVDIAVGDVSLENFGMSLEDYAEISRSTCEVYHSAALVNTVLPYSKLHSVNIGGVRKILEFCLHGAPKKLHYVSTLSVFVGSDRTCKIAKEDDDLSEPCRIFGGYAQSKWTAERLLLNARECGMEVVIYRLGLITGDTKNGVMKETDILSAVLRSLVKTGQIPEEEGGSEPMAFDVTPVDFAAKTVALLASKHQKGDPKVFHVSGKQPVTLSSLVSLLSECGVQIERVAKGVWEEQVTNQNALAFVGLSRALDHKNWTFMRTFDIFQATGITFDQENTEALLKDSLEYPRVYAPLLSFC
jgi:thioester reductase-like protein